MAKGPAAAVYTTPLISLLLVALALFSHFQATESARPSPEEPVQHDATGEAVAPPAVADGTAAPSSTTAESARDEVGRKADDDGVVVGSGNSGGALVTRPRRFLSSGTPPVEGGADSAARSCHTNDPHVGCGPPSHN